MTAPATGPGGTFDPPRRRLGASSVHLPPLGFGTGTLGNLYRAVSDEAAAGVIGTAFAAGVDYFDTAPHYGFGLSETRLGRALAEHDPGERTTVSTKVGRLLRPVTAEEAARRERHGFVAAAPFEPVFDYGYDAVLRSFDESRRRLGRERIDVLLAHDLGRAAHGVDDARRFAEFVDGGYRAMRRLRDEGAVGAIGLGVNETEIGERVMAVADLDVILLAGRYTLLEQGALDTFFPACEARNVSVIVGGPFNSGILVQGTRARGASGAALHSALHYNYGPAPESVIARVRRLEAACDAHGVPLAAAALQFPLAHPRVACVLPGLSSSEEAEQAVAYSRTPIPAAFWQALRDEGLVAAGAPLPSTPSGGTRTS